MAASYIDTWVLKLYQRENAQKFLPFLVDDMPTDNVPPILSEEECPYNKLCEMGEGVSIDKLFSLPEFDSLRSLVNMWIGMYKIPAGSASQGKLSSTEL